MATVYPYDINASLDSNRIVNEIQTFPSASAKGFSVIAPKLAPFHKKTFELKLTNGTKLIPNVDYEFGWYYDGLSNRADAPEIFMVIVLKNVSYIAQNVVLAYHTVGAEFTMENAAWQDFARSQPVNPIDSVWDVLDDRPGLYSTDPNLVLMKDAVGWDRFISVTKELVDEGTLVHNRIRRMIDLHVNNEVNAHDIDVGRLGLDRFLSLKKATLATLIQGTDSNQYLGVIETRAFLKERYVELGKAAVINLIGPTVAYQGSSASWVISDYDSFSTYEVSASFLDITLRDSNIVTTVKDEAPIGKSIMTIYKNGAPRLFEINILGIGIGQPSIIGIMDNESNVSPLVSVNTSSFFTEPTGADTFANVQYEISRTETFSDIIFSFTSNSTGSVTTDLPDRTRLYARAKHIGKSNRSSAWSPVISFITGDRPIKVTKPVRASIGWQDRVTIFTDQTTGKKSNAQVEMAIRVSSLSQMSDETLFLEVTDDSQTRTVSNRAYSGAVASNQSLILFSFTVLDHLRGPREATFKARYGRDVDGVITYGDWSYDYNMDTISYMD